MLSNKTYVITGASGIIGKCVSLTLAKCGANLILVGKDKEKLSKLGEHILKRYKHDPLLCPVDFLTLEAHQANRIFSEINDFTPRLDGLIHAAGIAPPLTPISELSQKDYLNVLQINAHAKIYLSQAALPLLRQSDHGQILFCEPEQKAVKPFHALEAMVSQLLEAFAKTLSEELIQTNVRARCLSFPPINSPYRQKGYPFEDKANNLDSEALGNLFKKVLKLESASNQREAYA